MSVCVHVFFLSVCLCVYTNFPNPPCLQVDRHPRQTSMVLVRAGEGQRFESRQSNDVKDIKVPAGEAVDIFYRYGTWLTVVVVVDISYIDGWLLLLLLLTSSTDMVTCSLPASSPHDPAYRFLLSLGPSGSTRRPRLVVDP